MSKPTVAFYMHDLSGGGVERMRLTLIEELRQRGFSVTLVVALRQGALTSLLPRDLPVVELGCARTLSAVRPLAAYLRQARQDVLISSLDHNNITAILARFAARVTTKLVICQHNALSAERSLGWRYRIIPWLYWALQHGTHSIVAVSRGVADDLSAVARIPRERITTIYNPVIDPGFFYRTQEPAEHPWLQDDADCPAFIFVGRLTEQKDPSNLVRAMAQLRPRSRAKLIILGEGPLLPSLKTLAEDLQIGAEIAFEGFQRNPLPWIKRAKALILSSRYEGLGNVIVEALACGTPVIATDCPHGPSEILLNGKFGRLVPVGNSLALSQAMFEQLNEPIIEPADALVARSRAFSAAACADAHEALFTRLLETKPVYAFGMKFSSLRSDEIVAEILTQRITCDVNLVVTPNLDHVRLLGKAEFAAAYQGASVICPDGLPVLLYAKLRGLRLTQRVTGCDIFRLLANDPNLAQQRLFLVVESERTEAAALAWARERRLASCVQVAVAPLGLAEDTHAQSLLASSISAASPTILVMTLGAPLSEVFVHRHRDSLPPCWALCVGQALRVELGLTKRAPAGWRRLGLEWLWRLRQEPQRLVGRYARSAAWFPIAVLRDCLPGRHERTLQQLQ